MIKIRLTQGYYALVDEKDSLWVSQWNWSISNKGYAVRIENKKRIWMHNEILIKRIGLIIPEGMTCDHEDRDRLNNQRYNLRIVTRSISSFNHNIQSNNTSGFRGIFWNKQKQKWQAQITVNYKKIHLGHFENRDDALAARKAAETYYFNENPD
jgi:hypothetical protein